MSKAMQRHYDSYRKEYMIQKKRGNIVSGQRMVTRREFALDYRAIRDPYQRSRLGKEYLKLQKKFKNEKQEMAMYKKYMAKTKQLKRGQTLQIEATRTEGLGNVGTEVITLKKREKLSSFVRNTGLRDLISLRISQGEDREDVLDDYGY